MSCPHCGASVAETQSTCPNCGTALGDAWPPAVSAGPPKVGAAPVRLLTGKVWLDEVLGTGLYWLLFFSLFKAASLANDAYITYIVRLPLSQEPLPFYFPSLGVGVLAAVLMSGIYAALHCLLPKVGRSFGQMALWGVGTAVVIVPLMMLFR